MHLRLAFFIYSITNSILSLLNFHFRVNFLKQAFPNSLCNNTAGNFLFNPNLSNYNVYISENLLVLQLGLDEASFENYKNGLIAKLLEKDPSLSYETSRLWNQIVDKRYCSFSFRSWTNAYQIFQYRIFTLL